MSKRILGLDLGIASIGWAVIDYDKEDAANNVIVDSGVRIYTAAENPKDGSALALPRREARGARRVTKRRAKRVDAVKRLLIETELLSGGDYETLFIGNKKQKDVWQLRAEALHRLLDPKELARILVHLTKHRSYQSNRKNDSTDDAEGKKVLAGIADNRLAMQKIGAQTIGEYLFHQNKKRNSRDDYSLSISRDMLRGEIDLIFKKQSDLGNAYATDKLLERYKDLAFTQRPFASVEKMVGTCPFEAPEKRASKSTVTFETFRALQKLSNLRIETPEGETALTQDEIEMVFETAKEDQTFSYKKLRSTLKFDKAVTFKGLLYHDIKTGELLKKSPETATFLDFKGFYTLQNVIAASNAEYWGTIKENNELLDQIATILTVEKDEKAIAVSLRAHLDHEDVIGALSGVTFSKFGHLSLTALRKINVELAKGLDYDKACDAAGYDFKAIFKGEKQMYLPGLSKQESLEMTNPVVKRAISQLRKVFNAIVRKYGEFDAVHVELTREIKKSHKDRQEVQKGQKDFQAEKERAKEKFKSLIHREPTAAELLKFRLLEQQDGFSIYSKTYISPDKLIDPFYCEVDHILPYSRSMDDSLNNKVLCLSRENQEKGNQTPFEYFGSDSQSEKWLNFAGRVEACKQIRKAKRDRLLKKNFDDSSENAFKERNKTDTSYITTFVKDFIEAHAAFKPSNDRQHVFSRNGMLTSQLRFKWGVGDKNRENHLHHAEDAIIVAFATQSEVQRLSEASAKKEGMIYEKREAKGKQLFFKAPMENFHAEVKKSVEDIFVSHMPRKKVTGAAHKATIYSHKTLSVRKADDKIDELKGNSRTHNVKLPHGIALNDGMPRVDVFQHKTSKKYYLVPIYVSDFVKEVLPNKAIVSGNKPWIEMDEAYAFKFSLYKSELIEVQTKKTKSKESVTVMGYYDGTHNGTGQISFKSHDGENSHQFGAQNLVYIKKYQVDPLGNYAEIKSEPRQGSIKENWQAKLHKRKQRRLERKSQKTEK